MAWIFSTVCEYSGGTEWEWLIANGSTTLIGACLPSVEEALGVEAVGCAATLWLACSAFFSVLGLAPVVLVGGTAPDGFSLLAAEVDAGSAFFGYNKQMYMSGTNGVQYRKKCILSRPSPPRTSSHRY